MSMIAQEEKEHAVGTTSKALRLLDEFSVERPEIGLSELHRRVGRDKATVHRHLTELETAGFVEQDPQTRAYRLGPVVLRLATIRETCFPLREAVAPAIEAAAADLGELVHFSLVQGVSLTPVYHADPHVHGTAVNFDPGALLPLHGTASGLAALAFGPEELRTAIFANDLKAHTSRTPVTPEKLERVISETRARGYASADRMFDPEVVSVALPLFGPDGLATGAVAAAFPAGRAQEAKLETARNRLVPLAKSVSEAIGGTLVPNREIQLA